ncbi:MFS transporter [Kitasatospora sp. NBC_01287]|uniref:MFS transporter n=1 Tax=Kitasatospora sp. NBC_01287 TaxID=2903573 RepID=UPI0022517DA5|nr:MFS transporter [Kitasatospora sp. NBC_01287]MCX4748178.1 MFS transporter [Kitasatospora sp. NBC_01287]
MTATNGLAGRRAWAGLAVLLLPTLVLSMDMGVLFFAVPFISTDLRPSGTQQLWIMDIYSFLLAGLLIPMGALGDRIGRRKLLMLGAAGFAAASLLAARSDGAAQLIAARALLGIAGSTLMPSTIALIRTLFTDPKQRRGAMAAWTGALTGGATLGPVVGGLLLDHFWWGSVFLVSVPVMALLLLLAPLLLPEYRAPRTGGFDLLGSGLALAAVLPTVYGVKTLAVDGLSALSAVALAVGLVMGALFVWRQRTAAYPLIDLDLFRNGTYSGAITVNTIAMFAMMGFTLFTSQYLQLVKGMSPLTAALWALLPSVGVGAAVGVSGALAGRVRPGHQMAGGFLVGAVGFALMTQVGPHSPLALILTAAGILAAGTVGTMTLTADLVVSAAPAERAGAAAATSETATELGSSLGIALLGAAGAAVYKSQLASSLPAGLPTEAARVAHDSLGGAVTVAAGLPAATAHQLLAAAGSAFTSGLHVAASVGLVCLLGAGLLASRLMRHLPAAGAETAGTAQAEHQAQHRAQQAEESVTEERVTEEPVTMELSA